MTLLLPLTPADIDADWMTQALQPRFPGVEVRDVQLLDAHAGTTGRALLGVKYAADSGLPPRLFAKLPPDDPAQRKFVTENGMGRREARFYRELADAIPVRVPDCYYAGTDDAGERYVMLLEDLTGSNCTFRNASTRYSLEYVRQVLAAFARLHAAFWQSPRFDDDLAWVEPPGFHPMGPRLVERALARYRAEMPPAFASLGTFYLENAAEIHSLWRQGAATLVHGDVHDGNFFYDEAIGEPGLLDWAITGRTSCMRDVAYFMTGTLKPGDRAVEQDALLEYYYGCLEAAGVTGLDRHRLWMEYRWHAAYVWIGGVSTLAMGSEWQPVNYVTRALQRLNLAIEDLDSVAALREGMTGA